MVYIIFYVLIILFFLLSYTIYRICCTFFKHPNVIRRILIVKLSSLGDVIHNIPMIYDLHRMYPEAEIDWVVEEAYIDLIQPLPVHPIAIGLRRWLKGFKKGQFFLREGLIFYQNLRKVRYDLIIDTQGLVKSAVVAWLAKKPGGKIIGLANRTIDSYYEFPVRYFYDVCLRVTPKTHDVDRSRWLALGEEPDDDAPRFYPLMYVHQMTWNEPNRLKLIPLTYVLFFHATADTRKAWPQANWRELGHYLNKNGYTVVLPWGSPAEHETSLAIAKALSAAVVPPALRMQDFYPLIAQARISIGVDTGLTHLAAALNRPTIEIYVHTHNWKTCGYWDENIINMGDKNDPPSVVDVLSELLYHGVVPLQTVQTVHTVHTVQTVQR